MDLERAIEVCVHAFAAGKSVSYPYLVSRHDRLWVMQDAPGRKRTRKIEVFSHGVGAEATIEGIRAAGLGWHFVCDVIPEGEDPAPVRASYKALGYRALATEWFFVNDLETVPKLDCAPPVRRVRSNEEWSTIPQHTSQPRKFRDGVRQYSVWDDARDYGWVHSVPYGEDAWVSDLYVHPDSRGRGFGAALMSRLLQDDKTLGVHASVLVASTSGARLYPHLGYRRIGTLQVFCPIRREP